MNDYEKAATKEILIESGTLSFTVDAASCLRQVEVEILTSGIAAAGMAYGVAMIRQTLYKIGTRALEIEDETLIQLLAKIGVLKQPPTTKAKG